jgi:glycosyltransferase involved in cell wall biosynthesis
MGANERPLITGHVDIDYEWRGGQRQAFLLTTTLAARGLPVHVFTQPGTKLAQELRGTPVQVHEFKNHGEWDLFAARRLARAARAAGVDLLAAHSSHAHGLAALALRFGAGAPLVVHRRVDFHVGQDFFNRRKYAAPAAFIGVSQAVRDMLAEDGVPRGKIHVVADGVPPFAPVADAKRRLAAACGLNPDLPWIGDVASLVGHKGHVHLLNAWAAAVQRGIKAELAIVGDGPLRGDLEAQIKRLGIGGSARLVGWREDVPAWFSAIDVFAMTSVTDGLCSAILDAMAARVPVVATAAGGIPELVRHDETGWLAPVGDAAAIAGGLLTALADKVRAAAWADRALREVWAAHSAEAMTDQTWRIYQELADPNSPKISK